MDALPVMQCLCSLRSMRHSRGGACDIPQRRAPPHYHLRGLNGKRWKAKGSEHESVLVILQEFSFSIWRRKYILEGRTHPHPPTKSSLLEHTLTQVDSAPTHLLPPTPPHHHLLIASSGEGGFIFFVSPQTEHGRVHHVLRWPPPHSL